MELQNVSRILLWNTKADAYLSREQNRAIATRNREDAARLKLISIKDKDSNTLKKTEHFHVVSCDDGMYLERTRMINPSPENPVHKGANRFELGFVTSPTQTWSWTEGALKQGNEVNVFGPVALEVGGDSADPKSPASSMRRNLTLRASEPPLVLVYWWQVDEQIYFVQTPNDDNTKKVMIEYEGTKKVLKLEIVKDLVTLAEVIRTNMNIEHNIKIEYWNPDFGSFVDADDISEINKNKAPRLKISKGSVKMDDSSSSDT